jgi:hypothetical protein
MAATLRVMHKTIGFEVRRGAYDVVVDGARVGSVELNNTFEIPVEPGRHALQVCDGRNSSRPVDLSTSDLRRRRGRHRCLSMRRKEAFADLSRVLRFPQPGTLAQTPVGAAPDRSAIGPPAGAGCESRKLVTRSTARAFRWLGFPVPAPAGWSHFARDSHAPTRAAEFAQSARPGWPFPKPSGLAVRWSRTLTGIGFKADARPPCIRLGPRSRLPGSSSWSTGSRPPSARRRAGPAGGVSR